MALGTLKGLTKIGAFDIMLERPKDLSTGEVDWAATDELRKKQPIYVDHDAGMISFKIQDGPVKESGVNGCQVDTLIRTAFHMIKELDNKFPCEENKGAMGGLSTAIGCLEQRRYDRQKRGVEGTNAL
jgi:hypothetical protein